MAISTGSGFKLLYRTFTGTTTSTPAYSPVGTLKKFTPPKTTMDKVDATLLSGVVKQSTPGLPELEASGTYYTDETDAAVLAFAAAVKQFPVPFFDFQVLYPSGAMKQFSGHFTEHTPSEHTVDENRTVDFTIAVTTPVTFTAAPSGS